MDSIRSSSGAAEQAQRLQPASQQPSGVDWHAFFGRSGAAMQQLQPGVLTPQGVCMCTDVGYKLVWFQRGRLCTVQSVEWKLERGAVQNMQFFAVGWPATF